MLDVANAWDPEDPGADTDVPDLREFDNEVDTAAAGNDNDLPDGRYNVRVNNATLGYTRNRRPKLTCDLVVLSGKYARRHLFKNSVFTKTSVQPIRRELKTLGIELVRFSELPHHLDELIGRAVQVTKRTKDGYVNIYFNKRLPELERTASDEIPF